MFEYDKNFSLLSPKRIILIVFLLVLVLLILPNARALYEGILYYVRPMIFPDAFKPVNRAGRYAAVYDLVQLRNAERVEYLRRHLTSRNIAFEEIAIPNSPFPNLFVRSKTTAPLTIYSAHYDKLYDDANYQGASDNTAALAVLLAAIDNLARSFD
ncbi:MAG: M28 family peptidase, partial [Chloroflexi bacterium]|nr:M28 family peptidase [Chloroflexota bacterium]